MYKLYDDICIQFWKKMLKLICEDTPKFGNISEPQGCKYEDVFWDVAPCSLVEINRRFRAIMEAASTSETSVISIRLHGATSQSSTVRNLFFVSWAFRTYRRPTPFLFHRGIMKSWFSSPILPLLPFLRSKYRVSTLFSNILNLRSYLRARQRIFL
jgi:hypothetical protein